MNLPEQHGCDGSAVSIDIQGVQKWRKLFILAGLFALLVWTPLIRARPELEHPVEHLGLIAIMICIFGRASCSLYIGGRKKQEIVSNGPYSLCRNPLYVFSFIGAVFDHGRLVAPGPVIGFQREHHPRCLPLADFSAPLIGP